MLKAAFDGFWEMVFQHQGTVKHVYKDHPRDQQNIVLIHRWSLYAGLITWKVHY